MASGLQSSQQEASAEDDYNICVPNIQEELDDSSISASIGGSSFNTCGPTSRQTLASAVTPGGSVLHSTVMSLPDATALVSNFAAGSSNLQHQALYDGSLWGQAGTPEIPGSLAKCDVDLDALNSFTTRTSDWLSSPASLGNDEASGNRLGKPAEGGKEDLVCKHWHTYLEPTKTGHAAPSSFCEPNSIDERYPENLSRQRQQEAKDEPLPSTEFVVRLSSKQMVFSTWTNLRRICASKYISLSSTRFTPSFTLQRSDHQQVTHCYYCQYVQWVVSIWTQTTLPPKGLKYTNG